MFGVTGYYYGYQGISQADINQVQGINYAQFTGSTGTRGFGGFTGRTGTTGTTGITGANYQGNTGGIYFGKNLSLFDGKIVATNDVLFKSSVIVNNQMHVEKINQVWKFSK